MIKEVAGFHLVKKETRNSFHEGNNRRVLDMSSARKCVGGNRDTVNYNIVKVVYSSQMSCGHVRSLLKQTHKSIHTYVYAHKQTPTQSREEQ